MAMVNTRKADVWMMMFSLNCKIHYYWQGYNTVARSMYLNIRKYEHSKGQYEGFIDLKKVTSTYAKSRL